MRDLTPWFLFSSGESFPLNKNKPFSWSSHFHSDEFLPSSPKFELNLNNKSTIYFMNWRHILPGFQAVMTTESLIYNIHPPSALIYSSLVCPEDNVLIEPFSMAFLPRFSHEEELLLLPPGDLERLHFYPCYLLYTFRYQNGQFIYNLFNMPLRIKGLLCLVWTRDSFSCLGMEASLYNSLIDLVSMNS